MDPYKQGFLACQLDTREGPAGRLDESCVCINKVGTFGVNCASYGPASQRAG